MSSFLRTKSLLQHLNKYKEYNAPLVNVVERNCHEDVKLVGDSVRIRDKISGTYLFSAANWNELECLLEDTEAELDTFIINTGKYQKEIFEKFPYAMISEYDLYVIDKKNVIHNCQPIKDFEITKLNLNWLNFILDCYDNEEFSNESYISDRILSGQGLGLLNKSNGEKAAFILQHKDGETGALVVKEKYRGRGLGGELLKCFNKVLLKENSILFAFVEKNNIASIKTVVSSGYKKVSNSILCVYLKKYTTAIPTVEQVVFMKKEAGKNERQEINKINNSDVCLSDLGSRLRLQ